MDIIATVLRVSGTGSSKTHIMYDAYLSYAQTKEYLDFLLERELIRQDPATRQYSPTRSGTRLLETYDGISELIRVGGTRSEERLAEVSAGRASGPG